MNYMQNNIYICGIDIGNYQDFPTRTKNYLEMSDLIVVEHIAEFNKSLKPKLLLKHNVEIIELNFSISKTQSIVDKVIYLAERNKVVSVICNSGMPSIFDPGIDLINELQKKQISFKVVPGPTSLITALVCSGFDTSSFMFEGGVGHGHQRVLKFKEIKEQLKKNKTVVFFELVHESLSHTIEDMLDIFGNETRISICINLTMSNEQIFTGHLEDALKWAKDFSENRDPTNHNINITYVCHIVV
jgi:16S rRNA (cytidine1402-2'-O)-methyltransferase